MMDYKNFWFVATMCFTLSILVFATHVAINSREIHRSHWAVEFAIRFTLKVEWATFENYDCLPVCLATVWPAVDGDAKLAPLPRNVWFSVKDITLWIENSCDRTGYCRFVKELRLAYALLDNLTQIMILVTFTHIFLELSYGDDKRHVNAGEERHEKSVW